MNDQPIVACATPRGEGAVSIVRISGSGVFQIADQCFKPVGGILFSSAEERRLIFGKIFENDRVIDQCLAVRFIGPRSFSGEDMVEFQLHGNPLIVNSVIRICVDLGCRLAEPGEFSRRAFLRGKMDLSQAEALAEVIRAESDAALDLAQRQLGGALSLRFREFREKIVNSLALLELELDFVQEGYELLDYMELASTLTDLTQYCHSLLDIYRSGDRLRRGPRILLLGRPNAGKSSLFNAILGHSRALVSDIPGTTRDYLEERILYRGVILHLLDTAGLRITEDALEAEGVSRAQELLPLADTVLYLLDSSLPDDVISEEFILIDSLRSNYPQVSIIPLFTKSDLVSIQNTQLSCSVHDRSSILALLDLIVEQYCAPVSDRLALLSERQHHILRAILTILEGIEADPNIPAEFLSADLRQLLTPLSELTGEITNEDILDSVFSGFCIGK